MITTPTHISRCSTMACCACATQQVSVVCMMCARRQATCTICSTHGPCCTDELTNTRPPSSSKTCLSLCLLVDFHTPLPAVGRVLCDTAIHPSLCSSPRHAAALGYRHAGCLQLSHVWTADPTVDGRRSAASRTAIGRGHIVLLPPGCYLVCHLCFTNLSALDCCCNILIWCIILLLLHPFNGLFSGNNLGKPVLER